MANAVMDGADAFLLGAETLRGFYPVLTIATILSIARQAEAVFDHMHHFDHLMTVRLCCSFELSVTALTNVPAAQAEPECVQHCCMGVQEAVTAEAGGERHRRHPFLSFSQSECR